MQGVGRAGGEGEERGGEDWRGVDREIPESTAH